MLQQKVIFVVSTGVFTKKDQTLLKVCTCTEFRQKLGNEIQWLFHDFSMTS